MREKKERDARKGLSHRVGAEGKESKEETSRKGAEG